MHARRPLDDEGRAALESWIRDIGPRLLAFVRRAYGSAVDAEEVVAETFCRAAARYEALSECEGLERYLFKIARNLCRDRFRGSRTESAPQDFIEARPDESPAPEEYASRREDEARLRSAVAQLPPGEREVVVLRTSGGLTFQEIADVLQIPLGTALSRMHRALERLRRLVGATQEHA